MGETNVVKTQRLYSRNCELKDGLLLPEGMRRIAMSVEYNGVEFHGFQAQRSGVATVQQALEQALSRVADEPISLVCAGRTDAGVHGTNQVVHFDTLALRPTRAWTRGVRAHLPDGVSVRWALQVPGDFHARFSARSRTYRYVICNRETRPALMVDQLTWHRYPLDVALMQRAANYLLGEHDFSAFRASQCQARSPVRCIEAIDLVRRGELIVMEVRANAFLHHMVRNIVGALLPVGEGLQSPEWVAEVLASRSRCAGGVTAPPQGLYLVSVDYPSRFALPDSPPGPALFSEPVGGFAGQ